jgi:hypothetical protein
MCLRLNPLRTVAKKKFDKCVNFIQRCKGKIIRLSSVSFTRISIKFPAHKLRSHSDLFILITFSDLLNLANFHDAKRKDDSSYSDELLITYIYNLLLSLPNTAMYRNNSFANIMIATQKNVHKFQKSRREFIEGKRN